MRHYKIKEVAEQLGVSPSTVRALINRGDLPAIDVGLGDQKNFRISDSDVEAFCRSRMASPTVKKQRRVAVKKYV